MEMSEYYYNFPPARNDDDNDEVMSSPIMRARLDVLIIFLHPLLTQPHHNIARGPPPVINIE